METTKKRIILGLDVSTTCIGTSIVSLEGTHAEVLYVHYVKFKNSKKYKGTDALFYKVTQFIDNFMPKIKEWGITDVVIEEPLATSNNALTCIVLAKFNGMISQCIYEAIGVVPKYISSYDARKYAFPELLAVRKYNKKDEPYNLKKILSSIKKNELVLFGEYPFSCAKKSIIWNKVSDLFPDIKWTYDKNNELTVENYDASDSLVCVLGYAKRELYGEPDPIILKCEAESVNRGGKKKTTVTYTVAFGNEEHDKIIQLNE